MAKSCHKCSSNLIDLAGKHFGLWTVIKRVGNKNGQLRWECKCRCGETKIVYGNNLKRGISKGCTKCTKTGEQNIKHGMAHTRFHGIWQGLKNRCRNKNVKAYKDYGGRGIKFDERWDEFNGFYNDMFRSYNEHIELYGIKNTTLDRIDVNGDYTKNNCRWATFKEQGNNRRDTIFIDYYGKNVTLSELSSITNINRWTLATRYKNGDRGEDLWRKKMCISVHRRRQKK